MSFSEICIYQVKPQKMEEFEALLPELQAFLTQQTGVQLVRFVKRDHHIDLAQIKEGLPPPAITRVVKSVKYVLYWEFDTKENYGLAQKRLYETHWKPMEKCLLLPHDKYLGAPVF